MSNIELELFQANSFMGIDRTRPVVVDFTKRKKNQRVVEFVGDEALCKTSSICGILYAMGAAFDINKKQLFNTKDGTIDESLKFSYDGDRYEVVVSGDRLILKKFHEDSDKWKKEDEPVATLKKMFGPVGLSPFALRTMKGKDQIEYIQDLFGSGQDTKKKHRALEEAYDELFDKRREVNREIKNLTGALNTEPLYINREESEKAFTVKVTADKERKAYEEISTKNREYLNYQNNTQPNNERILREKTSKVAELQKQLKAALEEEKKAVDVVDKGKKWLSDNKNIPTEFAKADKDWMNLSTKLKEQDKWNDILQKEKALREYEAATVRATSQLIDLESEMMKLTASYLPKIPGLKLKFKPSIDKDKEEVGLFYNGMTMAQLNESEFAKLWARVFVEKNISFLFVENLNSYGSGAVSVLNELAKEDGVLVFGTRMDRKKKSLEIVFNAKIE